MYHHEVLQLVPYRSIKIMYLFFTTVAFNSFSDTFSFTFPSIISILSLYYYIFCFPSSMSFSLSHHIFRPFCSPHFSLSLRYSPSLPYSLSTLIFRTAFLTLLPLSLSLMPALFSDLPFAFPRFLSHSPSSLLTFLTFSLFFTHFPHLPYSSIASFFLTLPASQACLTHLCFPGARK